METSSPASPSPSPTPKAQPTTPTHGPRFPIPHRQLPGNPYASLHPFSGAPAAPSPQHVTSSPQIGRTTNSTSSHHVLMPNGGQPQTPHHMRQTTQGQNGSSPLLHSSPRSAGAGTPGSHPRVSHNPNVPYFTANLQAHRPEALHSSSPNQADSPSTTAPRMRPFPSGLSLPTSFPGVPGVPRPGAPRRNAPMSPRRRDDPPSETSLPEPLASMRHLLRRLPAMLRLVPPPPEGFVLMILRMPFDTQCSHCGLVRPRGERLVTARVLMQYAEEIVHESRYMSEYENQPPAIMMGYQRPTKQTQRSRPASSRPVTRVNGPAVPHPHPMSSSSTSSSSSDSVDPLFPSERYTFTEISMYYVQCYRCYENAGFFPLPEERSYKIEFGMTLPISLDRQFGLYENLHDVKYNSAIVRYLSWPKCRLNENAWKTEQEDSVGAIEWDMHIDKDPVIKVEMDRLLPKIMVERHTQHENRNKHVQDMVARRRQAHQAYGQYMQEVQVAKPIEHIEGEDGYYAMAGSTRPGDDLSQDDADVLFGHIPMSSAEEINQEHKKDWVDKALPEPPAILQPDTSTHHRAEMMDSELQMDPAWMEDMEEMQALYEPDSPSYNPLVLYTNTARAQSDIFAREAADLLLFDDSEPQEDDAPKQPPNSIVNQATLGAVTQTTLEDSAESDVEVGKSGQKPRGMTSSGKKRDRSTSDIVIALREAKKRRS